MISCSRFVERRAALRKIRSRSASSTSSIVATNAAFTSANHALLLAIPASRCFTFPPIVLSLARSTMCIRRPSPGAERSFHLAKPLRGRRGQHDQFCFAAPSKSAAAARGRVVFPPDRLEPSSTSSVAGPLDMAMLMPAPAAIRLSLAAFARVPIILRLGGCTPSSRLRRKACLCDTLVERRVLTSSLTTYFLDRNLLPAHGQLHRCPCHDKIRRTRHDDQTRTCGTTTPGLRHVVSLGRSSQPN